MKLGFLDPDEMLRRIPHKKFLEWKAFESLEPFGEERADWNAARIVQLLARTGKALREYMLPFGDYAVETSVTQTLAYQEHLIDAWIFGHDEALKAKESGKK